MNEKIMKYQRNSLISFHIRADQSVDIQSVKTKKHTEINFPIDHDQAQAEIWGKWVIEYRDSNLYLFENNRNLPNDTLQILFQGQNSEIVITYQEEEDACESTEKFNSVEKIELFPGKVGKLRITLLDTPENRLAASTWSINFISSEEHTKMITEKDRTIAKLNTQVSELNAQITAVSTQLQRLISCQLDAFLADLEACVHDLLSSNKEKLKLLKDIKNQKEQLDKDNESCCTEMKGIKTNIEELKKKQEELLREREQLNGVEEVLTLDCTEKQEEIRELKQQADLDKETIELLEDDRLLKKNSVAKTIENIEKELEAVERRIGLIIKIKETIGNKVQNTVLSGDGTISSEEEAGADIYGIRSAAEEKNQRITE